MFIVLCTQQVEAPVEAPTLAPVPVQPRSHEVATETSELETVDIENSSTLSVERIPRPGLSQSFRRMKTILFQRSSSPGLRTRSSLPDSLDASDGYVSFTYFRHLRAGKLFSQGIGCLK